MEYKYIIILEIISLVFLVISLSCFLVSAYSAPTHDNVNLILNGTYTAPAYNNVNLVLGEAADSCTSPGSGNWEIDCSDNCVWDLAQSIPGNMTITGSGNLTLSAKFTFTGSNQFIILDSGCELIINSGGES